MLGRHFLALSLGCAAAGAQRTCYWPNGDVATGLIPCTNDTYTHCCVSESLCMSNGYCLRTSQPYVLNRGGCTDSSWGADCNPRCTLVAPAGGIPIVLLNTSSGVSNYCCGEPVGTGSGTSVRCESTEGSFTVPNGDPIYGFALLAGVTDPSISTSASASASASTSTSAPAASTSASGAASATSESASGNTSGSISQNSGSKEVAVGAGVGVPLGALAIAAVCWALWERRRARRGTPDVHELPSRDVSYPPYSKSPDSAYPNSQIYHDAPAMAPPSSGPTLYSGHTPSDMHGSQVGLYRNADPGSFQYSTTTPPPNATHAPAEMPLSTAPVEIMDWRHLSRDNYGGFGHN
ncbi:hypothetical protein GQ53DRAFT_740623 [Thozetella sp. PMI_491]|nr:hypothetical protein GQ53DRAFT_740623 [Thozetella sp. PMI_491]